MSWYLMIYFHHLIFIYKYIHIYIIDYFTAFHNIFIYINRWIHALQNIFGYTFKLLPHLPGANELIYNILDVSQGWPLVCMHGTIEQAQVDLFKCSDISLLCKYLCSSYAGWGTEGFRCTLIDMSFRWHVGNDQSWSISATHSFKTGEKSISKYKRILWKNEVPNDVSNFNSSLYGPTIGLFPAKGPLVGAPFQTWINFSPNMER